MTTPLLPTLTPTHSGSMPAVNRVYHTDALTMLRAFADGSIDLIVTSPPYNLGMRGSGGKWKPQLVNGYENHDDAMPHAEYVQWQRRVLTECLRVIPDNGAIFYNHKWRIKDGLIDRREDVVSGFPIRQVIIWARNGGMNFNAGYFVPTFEVIYLICKPDFKLAGGASGYGDVWNIPHDTDNPHPAPFPLQLAERCIMSTDAQLVCDPFAGSGTTLLAAANLRRQYIGCDISPAYVESARRRLAQPYTMPLFAANATA